MKKIFTIFTFMLSMSVFLVAQNTADLFIENPTVNGALTKFSWEIHITPTNDWGSGLGDKALGDCSWYFDYNSTALTNPVITLVGAGVTALSYASTVGITGGRVFVDTKINTFDPGVPLTQGVKYHVYTVEMDISNSILESDLVWDGINTGILSAPGNSVIESYNGSGDVPLPVELTSFKVNSVEGTMAQLQWETATEVNNYGFEVERSNVIEDADVTQVAGKMSYEWEKVAFIEGHGNSNSFKLYSFTDKNLVGGIKFMYRLKQIDINGTFEYSDAVEIEVYPTKYELYQNYPNPFNPTTNIKFSLPEDARIAINIYNLLGEKVTSLLNDELKAGFHQVDFNTNSAGYTIASGVYIYTIESKNFTQVKKMMLLK